MQWCFDNWIDRFACAAHTMREWQFHRETSHWVIVQKHSMMNKWMWLNLFNWPLPISAEPPLSPHVEKTRLRSLSVQKRRGCLKVTWKWVRVAFKAASDVRGQTTWSRILHVYPSTHAQSQETLLCLSVFQRGATCFHVISKQHIKQRESVCARS